MSYNLDGLERLFWKSSIHAFQPHCLAPGKCSCFSLPFYLRIPTLAIPPAEIIIIIFLIWFVLNNDLTQILNISNKLSASRGFQSLFILFNKVNGGVFCSLILIDFLNWSPLEIINQQTSSAVVHWEYRVVIFCIVCRR